MALRSNIYMIVYQVRHVGRSTATSPIRHHRGQRDPRHDPPHPKENHNLLRCELPYDIPVLFPALSSGWSWTPQGAPATAYIWRSSASEQEASTPAQQRWNPSLSSSVLTSHSHCLTLGVAVKT
jgi:hypothetical protein